MGRMRQMSADKQKQTIDHTNQSIVFLATTSLEDFWDTSKSMLFLGDWCRRYSRRSFWVHLGGEVISGLWKDRQKFHKAYHYVNDVYERLLQLLAEALNNMHGKKYSNRYWRIVIGPWLSYYISVLYDRYMSLRTVLDQYPCITTIGLSEECFVTPRDTRDFITLVSDDSYNLQLYTKVLIFLGKDFPKKTLKAFTEPRIQPGQKFSLNRRARNLGKNFVKFFFNILIKIKNEYIILASAYFPYAEELKIFLKTGGKVLPLYKEKIELPSCPLNHTARIKLQNIGWGNSEFETLLKNLLPFDIPQSFIESYEVIEKAQYSYPPSPKAILSAVSWYLDDAFKHWAAASAEKGTILLGIQHGGNYGIDASIKALDHELMITDCYYSWGWKRSDCVSKVITLPATKLVGRKKIGASNQKEGILFGTSGSPRYLYQFEYSNNYEFGEFFDWQFRFISSLSPKIRAEVRVRIYHSDYGWDVMRRWADLFPDVNIEKWEIPFKKSLENCRLFVCNHLQTIYAEALSADKPTILFWNPQVFEVRTEAQSFFKDLRAEGILHDTPESAAKAVNSVYDDVESWWNEPGRQVVIKKFCEQFARTSPSATDEWANELNQIVKRAVNEKK